MSFEASLKHTKLNSSRSANLQVSSPRLALLGLVELDLTVARLAMNNIEWLAVTPLWPAGLFRAPFQVLHHKSKRAVNYPNNVISRAVTTVQELAKEQVVWRPSQN